jgi:hypothetical protein
VAEAYIPHPLDAIGIPSLYDEFVPDLGMFVFNFRNEHNHRSGGLLVALFPEEAVFIFNPLEE